MGDGKPCPQKYHEFYTSLDSTLSSNSGYVEELTRIGRKSLPRRPIVIELTSKSMVKYLLQYSRFLETLAYPYLNTLTRQPYKLKNTYSYIFAQRAMMDNKLIIDGKIVHTYLQKLNSLLSPQRQSNSPSNHASRYTSPASTIARSQQLAQEQDPTQNNTFRH
ncbi:hypothetical protein ACJJTC_011047 [Scirpophaga incertulas]